MDEDWLKVYENGVDRLSNNLRLNEISTFFQFYLKRIRNQLEVIVKETYSLHPNKYFEILHLIFWERSLVMRRFGFHSNSRGADEIKGLSVSIDFRNTELLLLLSIISLLSNTCIRWYYRKKEVKYYIIFTESTKRFVLSLHYKGTGF